MYAACLHCAATFSRNDAIEALPIGRRIAFDAARGRLWIVCPSCQRWNLSPFDERWEAVEQCERAFRATRVRVSTENVGLARLRDGTELVRIGKPLRPEFAAWRYGDQFGRRRRKNALLVGATAVGAGVALAGMYALGASVMIAVPFLNIIAVSGALQAQRGQSQTQLLDGTLIRSIGHPRLIDMPEARDGWGIEIGFTSLEGPLDSGPTRPMRDSWAQGDKEVGRVSIPGLVALPLLRRVLPQVNRAGAGRAMVQDGVRLIEDVGGPEHFARWAATQRRTWAAQSTYGDTGDFQQIPEAARLAFEMSLHEDAERRALEGELMMLEQAWRNEEEIAGIADSLAIPANVDAALARLKRDERESR